jgi:hypothetical protein
VLGSGDARPQRQPAVVSALIVDGKVDEREQDRLDLASVPDEVSASEERSTGFA